MSHKTIRINPSEVPFVTHQNLTFQRNQTYRIRILNGQFDAIYTKMGFRTECN